MLKLPPRYLGALSVQNGAQGAERCPGRSPQSRSRGEAQRRLRRAAARKPARHGSHTGTRNADLAPSLTEVRSDKAAAPYLTSRLIRF